MKMSFDELFSLLDWIVFYLYFLFSMADSVYRPKHCAFHPKELIFNFCRSEECLLPLCPTCVDLHSEEHKQQKTYGKFINIHQVVNDITGSLETNLKELDNFAEEIKDHAAQRSMDEKEVRRKMGEAKEKVLGLVDRFFKDLEKQVEKSIIEFNVSMSDSYRDLDTQIKLMKGEIQAKQENLKGEKVLKTVISYYSKQEPSKIDNNLEVMRETLELFANKRAHLIIDNNSIQKMVNELSQYMYLSFENWEQDVKYVSDFVKTGFSMGSAGSSGSNRSQKNHHPPLSSRSCSVKDA